MHGRPNNFSCIIFKHNQNKHYLQNKMIFRAKIDLKQKEIRWKNQSEKSENLSFCLYLKFYFL